MKKLLISTLVTIAIGLISITPSTFANTPDGVTPANEGVCDDLKFGATNGLYGLCVAFCEAQDLADISTPITDEELDDLLTSAPSGKILSNYNKKQQPGDPDMPCIKVEEPCPCWSGADLAEIDGVMYDGHPANYNGGGYTNGRYCYDDIGLTKSAELSKDAVGTTDHYTEALIKRSRLSTTCQFARYNNDPEGKSTKVTLRFSNYFGNNTMTYPQAQICLKSLQEYIKDDRGCP